ncbi:hypothetical protein GALMADRAFT_135193 [Galerina marginata CBS 339.88]|uniref:B30.2/SPRY domain-containing protein n=1 Tax=Galerina marginata (strain CBS 339.88) TaxID=685588 RepID=A0A067THG3_GALM3|nr:hypothetical protein GALMADRAFT_135193 [Galerina marginata CBS 339.88]
MHAVEGSSPPPPDSVSASLLNNVTAAATTAPTRTNKRKRAPAVAAASPAPSDLGSIAGNSTDLLPTSRADLSSRPILTISRGPIFVPTAEGSEWFKTEMIGVNRVGYRYIPAGINPPGHATPCRTIESNPTAFRVSWEDRSPFLKVTKDGLGIAGSKGFRSARCNAPIREGKWYMEVKILHGGGERTADDSRREGTHVRLGWGRREAPLNAPVGLDGYSYGYRDKTGEKVALSRPRPYGRPFGTGDVVGMYISLPPRRQPNKKDPHDPAHLKRERIPIDLKGQEVFEILEYPQSKEMAALMDYSGKTTSSASVPSATKKTANGKLPERGGPAVPGAKAALPSLRPLPILPNSRIAFFVNGEPQGTAFQDLYDYLPLRQTDTQKANSRKRTREGVKEHRENPFDDGTLGYYPFISLFNDASVCLNPGPDFDFPPPDDIDAVLDGKTSTDPANDAPPLTSPPNLPLPMEVDVKPIIDTLTTTQPLTQASEVRLSPPPTITIVPSSKPDPQAQAQAQLPTPKRSWRPASERYPEFMQEEWAFDAAEDEQANADMAKHAAAEKAEEEKRKQREKKRVQAEARKKAKKEAVAQQQQQQQQLAAANAAAALVLEEDTGRGREKERYGSLPASSSGLYVSSIHSHTSHQPSPSPLRHSTAYSYEPEGSAEYEGNRAYAQSYNHGLGHTHNPNSHSHVHSQSHSPAPTHASFGDREREMLQGGQSGYTSENNHEGYHRDEQEQEQDDGMDVDQDIEAIMGPPSRPRTPA